MIYDPADHWHDGYAITDRDRRAREEFHRHPFGQQSPALQRILIKLRSAPMPGKYALLMRERHKEWVLVRMTGNVADPIEIVEEHVFTSLEDAERFVFDERWREHVGPQTDPE